MFSKNKKLKRTTLICIFLTFLLVGLFISKFTMPISFSWLILVILLLPLIYTKKSVLIVYVIFGGLIIGWWRGGLLQTQNQTYLDYFYKNVTVTGKATEDSYYLSNSQLQFMIDSVIIEGKKVPGKIQIKGFGEPMVYRHDNVKIKGKLYPSLGSKQANISFSIIDVTARAKSQVENFRRKFIVGMENALPEPAASFGIGLLVGQRSLLPPDVLAVLTAVGLTHVVAVSGYNLTIIIRAVTKSLKKLSRFQVLVISLLLIYLFLLITGFSPSIIRATIVSVFGLLAWFYGRTFRPILLILLAAGLTGFMNPYYVWGDIGWYLSFLAFFGVLILAPLLKTRIFGLKTAPIIAIVALESFSAQIMTMPLIMIIFGKVSLVGLLANIIIVPLVPFAMLLSVIAGLSGMFFASIAGWIALPARILLNIMLWLSAWLSHWPSAQILTKITTPSFVLLYIIIAIFIIGLKRRSISVTIKERLNKTR